ncbi:MAG TPA: uroporphyrinogen-III C-methyltransferase [Cyclobacteriaceae bacterium]|nr:uroporphyrinogen-III C-methyltransferase [Cyclobacteriaceae bacterium]
MKPDVKNTKHHPKITLIGAGPGDPELVTVKALRILKTADVVLYDALISNEILELIPKDIPAWSVGKRAGAHSFKQEEINILMVEFAFQYGHVVRLKGGDPFVFGRGQEEIEHALAKGIEVNVVPGVSSAFAVPASANIPLTRREVSESFWVVTGTTKSGLISEDLNLAAQSTATIVVLMGLSKIKEIAEIFILHGRSDLPVAVIQNGTLPNQRVVIGNVSTIPQDVMKAKLASPAIIVFGEVVRCASSASLKDLLHSQGMYLANGSE